MKRSDPPDARFQSVWSSIIALLASAPPLVASPSAVRADPDCPQPVAVGEQVTVPSTPANVPMAQPVAIVQAVPVAQPGAIEPLAIQPRWTLEQILVAIRHVESGTCPRRGARAVGDGGRAIGPYQIHRSYWQDSRVPGRFEDCFDATYARKVVMSYWQRHCPYALQTLDAQVLARVHNGGPSGFRKVSTANYWRRVERELTQPSKSVSTRTQRGS